MNIHCSNIWGKYFFYQKWLN